jgi:hypothetical protein
LRTKFKYERTSEAIALLSISLLAFALAIVFVAMAAASPDESPIVPRGGQHLLVALIFGLYCFIQVLSRVRYDRQAVDEPSGDQGAQKRAYAERVFVLGLPLTVTWTVCTADPPHPFWTFVVPLCVLGTVTVAAYWVTSSGGSSETLHRSMMVGTTVLLVGSAVFAQQRGWYGWQLAVAVAAAVGSMLPSLLGPTLMQRQRRRRYLARFTN